MYHFSLEVPPSVVTATGPVQVPKGTLQVILVLDHEVISPSLSLGNMTLDSPWITPK